MNVSRVISRLPKPYSILAACLSAIMLLCAFPDFGVSIIAYLALVPLFFAIGLERESIIKSAITGWVFGTLFFFGSCWWLAYAPIHYGDIPAVISYPLVFAAAGIGGIFPAIFAAILSYCVRRIGVLGMLGAPFVWIAIEYLRFSLTGNNWNAIGYSQAFAPGGTFFAAWGSVYLTGFFIIIPSVFCFLEISRKLNGLEANPLIYVPFVFFLFLPVIVGTIPKTVIQPKTPVANIVALQPNVPMSGFSGYSQWERFRDEHLRMAERELAKFNSEQKALPTTVIFPESPMNFGYTTDRDFQEYLRRFTTKDQIQVLFNAAEPAHNGSFFNSAVLVNEKGEKIAEYDKMHLVPFGEYVPLPEPLAALVPSMVGNFAIGDEYDIIKLGEAKAGIMICFESHFPELSREYVKNGADVLIEMTNDGYLGETAVLRQHLANAVFRAAETNRPILRVTNVGISTYIDENGDVHGETKPYTEDTRVWTVGKSDGRETFYVKYGEWFAWLCSFVTLGIMFLSYRKRSKRE